MANLSDRPTQVDDIVAVANAGRVRRLLTDTNFRVLSVEPYRDAKGQFNAIAQVEVDLYPDTLITIPDSKRYDVRRVPFCRVDIRKALKDAELEFDELGRLKVGSVADVNGFIETLGEVVSVDPEEVLFTAVSETLAAIRFKSDSLGYTGQVTLVAGEE